MAIKLYNTMNKKKEEFVPVQEGKVGIYVCGPTTYNYIHLGNARPITVFDTVRRYFMYRGYDVTFIQNFTDIDDKIINRAHEEGITPKEVAEKYIQAFFEDTQKLNIMPADHYPKVTENIKNIVSLIEKIIENGFAYEVDGDVYYAVRKFKDYGKLSGRSIDELKEGARVAPGEKKEDALDFALWKKAKEGEPSWDSPWGKGRPGWHIECSAMSEKYLGETFDIHGGGADLVFPHHENEIAQSEAAHGNDLARYWMHNGFITINQEKMSKSLGNFFMLRDVLEKYPGDVIRFFLLSTQYRSPLDFDDHKLDTAIKSLGRIRNAYQLLQDAIAKKIGADEKPEGAKIGTELKEAVDKARTDFINAMDDDFNTALASAVVFDFCHESNRLLDADLESLNQAKALFAEFDQVLGMILPKTDVADSDGLLSQVMEVLIKMREDARADKNWAMADGIRDDLKEIGIVLEDTAEGARWKRG